MLSSTTAVTNAAGLASITATANNIAGSYAVTANLVGFGVEGTLSTSFALTNTSGGGGGGGGGGVGSLTATGGTPQTAPTRGAFLNPLQVTLKDANGALVSGATITFTAPASGASAVLSSGTAVTNGLGVASVTATANAIAGSYLVTATMGTLSATFSLTNTTANVVVTQAAGSTPQSTAVNTAFANPLQLTVTDPLGNTVSGLMVTFTAPASGASAFLSSGSTVTNGNGIASVTAIANNIAGSYAVTATVSGLSVLFNLTNTAGQVTITATGGTPQTTAVNTAFTNALQVTVKDALGNTVGGVTVNFTAPASGASAILSSTTALSNSSGIASVTATANNIAGSYTVTATALFSTATFSLTNTAQGASNLALGRTASQSSTLSAYSTTGPGAAVDGVTDGNFFDGSVTHTNLDPNAWWQVDLGASGIINSITIWNRTDCCGNRLSDFWVFISDTPFLGTDTPATLQNRAGTFSSHQTSAPNPSTTIAAAGAQGRYIRVQLTGTNFLSLAEVQAFGTYASGPPPTTTNLSRGKNTAQSSTLAAYASAVSGSAVDGNTDGNFFDSSVTHTNLEASPWWQVDLGSPSSVNSIVIWNRTDCCGDRLSDYWVFVSNTPFLSTDTPTTLQNRAGTLSLHQTSAPNPSTTLQFAAFQGRYVRIQLTGTNYLSLTEVQVMGTAGSLSGSNLALGQAASQSSTLSGYATTGAGGAVDGNTDGNFFDGSVTHTNFDVNAWWQVDLGASSAVASVVVWNRTDCCSSRLGDFWVFVSDTPFTAADTPATLQSRAGTFSSHQTSAPAPSTSIPVGAQGRYVRVQLSGTNFLSLAEVQAISQ
ncbi:MAG: discoidin domain-containing protein [Acidobacteriia bacterium]|nr:discoidin domain-containing protein [Terriglobia bacterium]